MLSAAGVPRVSAKIILLPDTLTVHAAALMANATGLHLVIDRHGHFVLTPLVEPDMQRIAVLDKQMEAA